MMVTRLHVIQIRQSSPNLKFGTSSLEHSVSGLSMEVNGTESVV